MSNDLIAAARRRYLADNPLRVNAAPMTDANSGAPMGSMPIPNIGDMQVIGCKLGMEYLAICHDEDAVEDWIHTVMGIVKDPELLGILFANVFRGVNVVVGEIVSHDDGLRHRLEQLAIDAWGRDFSEATS